jgi:rod shape-determining protein MreB
MVLSALRRIFSSDLAIDLGTANTLIYQKGRGVVCNEPSVVAVQTDSSGKRKVVAVGLEAKSMLGRTPEKITTVRPLKNGVISDFDMTGELLRHLVEKIRPRSYFFRPRVVICVPHGVSEVEKRAVRESAEAAGAREVFLIEEPMAAAIGAGLPVTEARGSFILDVGGGTSEIAIISLRGIVFSQTLRVGGDKMDDAIVQYVRRAYNLLIGERTAEQIKIAIGSAVPSGEELTTEITGRDVVLGAPRSVILTEEEIREVLMEPLGQILEMVRAALEKTPPELAADIVERGITLTGGGALLRGFDRFLAHHSELPVVVVDDPLSSVVLGSGAVLDQFDVLRDVVWQ